MTFNIVFLLVLLAYASLMTGGYIELSIKYDRLEDRYKRKVGKRDVR